MTETLVVENTEINTLEIGDENVAVVVERSINVVTVGIAGVAGVGVPTGGATGQVLKKLSNANYDTGWAEDGGGVESVVAGINVNVDNTDPLNPIVNSLSDRYKTTSTTSQSIVSSGNLTFTVAANLSYVSQQEVIIAHDANNHMHGTVVSYAGTSLVVEIKHKTGSGTYNSWAINLDGTPVDAITGAGTVGRVPYFSGGQVLGSTNAYYDSATQYLGLNTNTPEGVLHIKEGTYTAPPEPTGSVTLTETDIGSGNWTNDGNYFEVRVYTYKMVQGVPIYSSTYISNTYADDGISDHNYNVLVEVSDALPTGADGFRAFVYWVDSGATVQWNFDRYFQFTGLTTTINGSPTTGTATSGTVVYKAIVENAETWFKNGNVRFMDSSGNTKAIWDKTNERFGVGTDAPTQYAHFKSTTTTLPTNPAGGLTISEVTGYSDPYENVGTTHTYRVYTYKLVGGQIILSNTFITGSYTDDGLGGSFYSLEVTVDDPVPSGADGYFITKAPSYDITSYWATASSIIDGGTPLINDNRVQFSSAVGRVLIEDSNIEAVYGGVRRFFFDSADGSFDKLKIKTRNASDYGLLIQTMNGQVQNPFRIEAFNGTNLFSIGTAGNGIFAAGISTGSNSIFQGGINVFGNSTFNNNLTVTGTLGVTGAATFNSTLTARSSTFTTSATGSVGLTVNGVAGQTADIAQFRLTSGGTLVTRITSAGLIDSTQTIQSAVGFRLTAFGAYVGVQNGARCTFGNSSGVSIFGTGVTSNVVSLIEAPTGQTADIMQWRVNSATVAAITAGGNLTLAGANAVLTFGSAGNTLTRNGSTGEISLTCQNFSGASWLFTNVSGNAATVLSKFRAHASQAGNLTQWENSGGTVQLAIAANGRDFVLDTTTGSKIGTATSQKLGFWNAAPIVQPTTSVAAATFVTNTSLIANDTATFDGYTIGQVVKALRNIGILA